MFEIKQRGSTVPREVFGGLTTFMAMSYIIFVQVVVLTGGTEIDGGGVMMATCLAAAAACVLMGLLANYPIALAPGMGENFFFVFIAGAMAKWGFGVGWQMALALTGIAGLVFLALSFVGFRAAVLNSLPDALKSGMAAGIGLLIAVAGFSYGNLLGHTKEGLAIVKFAGLDNNPAAWLTLGGLAVTLVLMARRVRGAILLGILITTGAAIGLGYVQWCGSPVAWPSGLGKTAGGALAGARDIWKAVQSSHALEVLTFAFVLLFMDLFDTVGTLVGVSTRAGLMTDGKLPRAERALGADAAGTVIGASLGTSTVTSYIESITGVAVGARTGLAAIVTGGLFVVAMFFQPLVAMIGEGIVVDEVVTYPMIAPALILVGAIMLRSIRKVLWDDPTEYVPAFLTMITMPLTLSISAGIAIGFVSFAVGKLLSGRARQCPVTVYIFAILFVVRYIVEPSI